MHKSGCKSQITVCFLFCPYLIKTTLYLYSICLNYRVTNNKLEQASKDSQKKVNLTTWGTQENRKKKDDDDDEKSNQIST